MNDFLVIDTVIQQETTQTVNFKIGSRDPVSEKPELKAHDQTALHEDNSSNE